MRGDARTRLAAKVLQDFESGCHVWLGAQGGSGYGLILADDRKMRPAHRVAYELQFGAVPDGLVVDHLCNFKLCVNPHHLQAVTQLENLMRSGHALAALNAAKTHCVHGHAFTPENTYLRKGRAGRSCRECTRRKHREAARRRSLERAA